MTKVLEIQTVTCCGWCPHRIEYFDYKTKSDKNKCSKTKRIIPHSAIHSYQKFPKWCPLEDYKGDDNYAKD